MAKSPSIILTEIDASSYAITTSDTVLAVVGYATMGPIGEAVTVTSRNEFVEKFGPPPTTAPWGSLSVYRAFNQGNQVIFYRVAEETGVNQSVGSERCITNASSASAGYQEFCQQTPVAYGSYTSSEVYDCKLEVNDSGFIRDVYIVSPASGDWTLSDIATQLNTQITSDTSGFQEWDTQSAPSLTQPDEYRFKADIDSADIAGDDDLSVFLSPGATLTSIAAAVQAAMEAGSRGFQRWDPSEAINGALATGLAGGTDYGLRVNVDGGGDDDILINGANAPTYTDLIAALQNAFDTHVPAATLATAHLDTDTLGHVRIQSKSEGVGSTIVITDDTAGGAPGGGLLAALDAGLPLGGGASALGVADDGEAGLAAAGNYAVAVHSGTGRIRITSESTGLASQIDMANADIGNQLGTLLGGALEANDGESDVAATVAVNSETGLIRITSNTTGASSEIEITAGTGADNEDLVTLLSLETAVPGADEVFEANTDNILFKAKEKGSATNTISVVKTSRTNPVDSSTIHKVEIYYDGVLKETYDNVSLETTSDDFFVSKINADVSNGGSEWITIEYEDNDADQDIDFPNGTYALGVAGVGETEYQDGVADDIGEYDYRIGTDGIPTSGGAALFVTALSTDGDLGNMERFDFHILITPDNGSEATQGAAITLCEYRQDAIYIADPPYGLAYDEVVDWHNGSGGHGRNAALNTSYASTYWPWLKDYSTTTREYVWCPPSVFIAEKYMEIDRSYGPWYAVAGDSRGKIIAFDYETSPSFAQREVLYGDLNAVNPIVNFVAKGLEIYGQKTLIRELKATNRVHVRRMVIYAKKLIKKAMEGIVFEPHNPDSWAKATNLINSILEPIRQKNGLDDYKVTIDASTNTADVIAQSIMKGIIKLVPVGVIEIIDLTISILSPGATIEEQ